MFSTIARIPPGNSAWRFAFRMSDMTLLEKHDLSDFLQNEHAFATSLLTVLIDQYGTEALDWEMQTILMELKDDLDATLPEANVHKLQAILTGITSDTFYRDPFVFARVCEALDGDPIDPDFIPEVTPDQMAWGITEIILADGPDHPEFDIEVRRFMGVVLDAHGMYIPPDVLRLANFPESQHTRASDTLGLDPDAYAAYHKRNKSDANDITEHVQRRLQALVSQLNDLPLNNRNQDSWRIFLERYGQKYGQLKPNR